MLKVLILASGATSGSLMLDVFEAGVGGLLDEASRPVTFSTTEAYDREAIMGLAIDREGPKRREVDRRAAIVAARAV